MSKRNKRSLIIATIIYLLVFAGLIRFGFHCFDKRELDRAARAVLETPDLTKGMCPSGYEPLPPIEPELPKP